MTRKYITLILESNYDGGIDSFNNKLVDILSKNNHIDTINLNNLSLKAKIVNFSNHKPYSSLFKLIISIFDENNAIYKGQLSDEDIDKIVQWIQFIIFVINKHSLRFLDNKVIENSIEKNGIIYTPTFNTKDNLFYDVLSILKFKDDIDKDRVKDAIEEYLNS